MIKLNILSEEIMSNRKNASSLNVRIGFKIPDID